MRRRTLGSVTVACVLAVAAATAQEPDQRKLAAPGPVAGQAWTIPGPGLELVYVAPGIFQMGSNDERDKAARPVHAVRISRGYWMGKTEVTQAEYVRVMGKNPSFLKGARLPVEGVSWNDAMAFCDKLTQKERATERLPQGYEYRLPTEAEWEYAARGGADSRGYTYSGSDNQDEVAWWSGNSSSDTHPVGTKLANELGLCDLSGNVSEWCLDRYDKDFYARSPAVDPVNLNDSTRRAWRGGDWRTEDYEARPAYRERGDPVARYANVGFRACLAPYSEGR